MLIGALRERDAFQPHAQPGVIHHGEHVLEPAILLADEITDRAPAVPVRQHACGRRAYAHLVLDRDAADIVALARRAICLGHELGNDEK